MKNETSSMEKETIGALEEQPDAPKKKAKPDIAKWKPRKSQILCEGDGKILIVHFDKIFCDKDTPKDVVEKYQSYSQFLINKQSCVGMMDTITHYINYFMNKYDPENELATAYLHMKYVIERSKVTKNIDVPILDEFGKPELKPVLDLSGAPILDERGEPLMEEVTEKKTIVTDELSSIDDLPKLINHIYRSVFTPSICEKIRKLADDNYCEDVESGNGKYKKANRKFLEDLEFTNQHIIILHRISFAMKIMCPVFFHFLSHHAIKLRSTEYHIYNAYAPLFYLFSDDVDMYNKLYIYIRTNVAMDAKYNTIIYQQREIMGDDIKTVVDAFLKIKMITDIMIKYRFDSNVLGLNKTVLKQQLMYFLKVPYAKTLVELNNDVDEEGLSGIDKLSMHIPKVDEGAVLYSTFNIEDAMRRIKEENKIEITQEEIQYYRTRHKPTKLQMEFVRARFFKYFGQARDLEQLGEHHYYLMILLKKQMLIEAGFDPDANGIAPNIYLPYILTGNMTGGSKQKQIRKESYLEQVYASYTFKELEIKYKSLYEMDPEFFKRLLSELIYSRITYICYEAQDWTGKEIEFDEVAIANEALTFLHAEI